MRSLLLPLRTNAAWFSSDEHMWHLRRRLKAGLLIYDELVVQDGRLLISILERASSEFYAPPGAFSGDRNKINFIAKGSPTSLIATDPATGKKTPLYSGPTETGYEVDFFPLLNEAGLTKASFIQYVGEWPTDIKNHATSFLFQNRAALMGVQQQGGAFEKDHIAKGYVMDTEVASKINAAVAMDDRFEPFTNWMTSNATKKWGAEFRHSVLNQWAKLELPDFTGDPWDDVLRLRESAEGGDFRQMLAKLEVKVADSLGEISSQEEMDDLVRSTLVREIIDELFKRRMSGQKAVVNLAVNFTPASLAGSVADFKSLLGEKRSWINLLRRLPTSGI